MNRALERSGKPTSLAAATCPVGVDCLAEGVIVSYTSYFFLCFFIILVFSHIVGLFALAVQQSRNVTEVFIQLGMTWATVHATKRVQHMQVAGARQLEHDYLSLLSVISGDILSPHRGAAF